MTASETCDAPSAAAVPPPAEAEFLRGLLDQLPFLISVQDPQGRFLFSNQAHTRFLGAATPAAVVGRTDADFLPPALARQYGASDQAALRRRQPPVAAQEYGLDLADRPRWLSTTRTPLLDEAGNTRAVLRCSQEITSPEAVPQGHPQSAELYRTLVESLPHSVFFKDTHSVFVSVNTAFARELGVPAAQILGQTDFDLFPRELAEKYRADDQRVMGLGHPEVLEERNIALGVERIVEVVKVPVVGQDGAPLGLLGIFTDITERKRAEAKLREFAAQLERSNRELQDFAYVASHDLQEPLRKVAVFGNRLQARCGPSLGPEGSDYLDRMLKAAVRMQTLINDLLAFARVDTRAQPFVPVNLDQVAREVLADLEARLEQVGGRVELHDLPTLDADAVQMRQLIQNLIGNALKFRRPDVPPVVTLRAGLLETEGEPGREFCQLVVQDNGIGFEDKYAERIFRVFQRLHGRGQYEGSGVGLAICRRIAERHGGQIFAHGVPGTGATFTVRLPVHQPKSPPPQ